MEIDFVITWVDDSDPEWIKQKTQYKAGLSEDDKAERYRDWNILKYWFRGVEAFAPWVRRIHFVTNGQIPSWLDTTNEKLHIVKHSDYLPKEVLPTFNSTVIENSLHKIEGLSEQFVYFNDDMFLLQPMKQEDFFQNGKPVDLLALQPIVANPKNPVMSYILLNDMLLLTKYFNKRNVMWKNPGKFFHFGYPIKYFVYNIIELAFPQFTGLYSVHGAAPFLKSTFETLWELEGTYLMGTLNNRFRNSSDVNQYLFREWQKLSGNFVPKNVEKYLSYFEIQEQNDQLFTCIKNKETRMICINDTGKEVEEQAVMKELTACFEAVLPQKSTFECC